MEQPSREEVARVDRVHRRADEAVQQILAGHISTSCVVLYPDENDGEQVTWNAGEIESWPGVKNELIGMLALGGFPVSVFTMGAAWHSTKTVLGEPYAVDQRAGRVMYRKSAAFVATQPSPDLYTRGDRAGEAARR